GLAAKDWHQRLYKRPARWPPSQLGGSLGEVRVLIRVGGRARADQPQGLGSDAEYLVTGARRDQRTVALADDPLLVVDDEPTFTGGDEVELLAEAMVVLGCR